MPSISQIVAQIRTALYGRDVRENIALGIEKCYDDVTDIALVQQNQPDLVEDANNKIWLKPTDDELSVPTYEEFSDLKSAFDEKNLGMLAGCRKLIYNSTWSSGGINSSTGSATTNSKRIRANMVGSCDLIYIHCAVRMKVAVFAFVKSTGTTGYLGVLRALDYCDSNGNVFVPVDRGMMHSVVVANESDTDISTSFAENVTLYKCIVPYFENEDSALEGIASDTCKIKGRLMQWQRGTINDSGVELGSNEYCIYSMDYLPVRPGRKISFTGVSSTARFLCTYDSNKTFISRYDMLEGDYTVTEGTAFVRFAYGNTTASGIKVTDGYDLIQKFEITVFNNSFSQYLERIGYIPFKVVKGIYRSNGQINTNSNGICQSQLMQLTPGTIIKVVISGDWVYTVWQGNASNSLKKTDRLVNYDEFEVKSEYVGVCFYKIDADGETINTTPEDFNQNVMLFVNGNTTSRKVETHDVPENIGVLNVINRAYQMAKLTYTPVANLPTQVNTTALPGYVPSGTKVTGVMYSSVRNEGLYVPQCVSLDSYMTALLNPNSYIYTRTEPSPHYNALTYYGAVCSSMVAWCYGIDNVIPTTISFDTYEGMEVIENQSPYGLKLGDMLNNSGNHIVIITDITRTSRGVITGIEVSEQVNYSSHPMTRRKTYKPETVQSTFFDNGYVAMRYHYIYKVPYTASPWVNLDDEAEEPEWNPNLSPRRGDKANWRDGETIEIDVTDDEDYTQVKLYKGDSLERTDNLPANDLIQYSNLDYGSYKVCLTDSVNDSGFVYFDIIDTHETYTHLGNKVVKVEFSSANGTPASISFCDSKSNDSDYKAVRGFHVLTDAEISAGEATVTAPDTDVRDSWLMKVMYKTEFGLYSSDLTSVSVV